MRIWRNLWECKGAKGFGAGEDLRQAGKTGKEKGSLQKWQQENRVLWNI
jgi:hypothetical protein